MTIGIYKFTNKRNNKVYIGQSTQIEERYKQHLNNSKNENLHDYNTKFYRALRKYGFENFSFDVLEIFSEYDKEQLNKKEIYWIDYYNSYEDGYNSNRGGEKVTERCEDHPMAKLTNEQVLEIKNLLKFSKLTQYEIANKFNIKQPSVSEINSGRKWSALGNYQYPIRSSDSLKQKHGHNVSILSDEEVMKIRNRYINETLAEIYQDYKDICSEVTIKRIVLGQTYKYLPIYKKQKKIWINN